MGICIYSCNILSWFERVRRRDNINSEGHLFPELIGGQQEKLICPLVTDIDWLDLQQCCGRGLIGIFAFASIHAMHFVYGYSRIQFAIFCFLLKWIVFETDFSQMALTVENGFLSLRQDQKLAYAKDQMFDIGPKSESSHLSFGNRWPRHYVQNDLSALWLSHEKDC